VRRDPLIAQLITLISQKLPLLLVILDRINGPFNEVENKDEIVKESLKSYQILDKKYKNIFDVLIPIKKGKKTFHAIIKGVEEEESKSSVCSVFRTE
jgi:hypothetical protein